MNDSRRIAEEAALWYLDMRDAPDAGAQERFMSWLRHSPRHVSEYLAIAQLHGDLRAAAALDDMPMADLVARAGSEPRVVPLFGERVEAQATRRPRHRALRYVAAAAVLLLVAGAVAFRPATPSAAPIRYTADASGVRMLQLPDDTRVQLSPGGIVDVAFDATSRRIALVAGRASFDIGHDPARPLSVEVGRQRIEDIGTVFDVDRDGDGARVAVVSGKVSVWHASASWLDTTAQRLTGHVARGERVADIDGGETVRVDGGGKVLERSTLDTAVATAWLPADIRFHDMPVAEVARRFNAYTTRPLRIDEPALAKRRISGVFHAHDPEAFVSYLTSLPGVAVERDAERIRVVAAPPRRRL
ncbi:MAG: Protein FecR [Luteibacter sp.]|uniref:FecR family protein n=1 Tax=Luteibacter sp. TaxID=1886636 RepID=UPI0013865CC2|nr:FecR domain-containing protein [Luteibacter sp.]KAF1007306.1 MAG: Protein FecR [Luteibacter sp.]